MKLNKVTRFVIVGVVATLFDFLVYNAGAFLVFRENLAAAAVYAGLCATILVYFLHKNFTWKEREADIFTVMRFFLWNLLMVLLVRPVLVWIFERMGGFYEFCFMISSWLRLPFSLVFIRNTGVYGFMTVVTMLLNFVGYEKVVFWQKVDVKSVRKAGKEKQGD